MYHCLELVFVVQKTAFFLLLINLPTNNLLTYLKRRYSGSQIRELNSIFKWRNRRISASERIAFLKLCLDNSVFPRDIYERVKKLKSRFASSIGRAFVKNEIAVEEEKLARLSRNLRYSLQCVSQFVSYYDWIRVNKLLGEAGCRLREKLRFDYHERLRWLKRQRFGSEELITASVFNFSSVQLTAAQMEVLARGPKFGIPPRSTCLEEIIGEFELYYKQVNSALLDSSLPVSKYAKEKDAFKAKLAGLAQDYSRIKQDSSSFPLGKEHMKALRELKRRSDIVITRPDKGAGVVLLNSIDYEAKMLDILNDPSKFECLGSCEDHDRTDLNEKALQAFLLRRWKSGEIGENVYKRCRPSGSIRPRMYGLPKVHKPDPIPLRPILSMVGSAQHELARWLTEVLEPVLTRYSSHVVSDSFTFCDDLREHRWGKNLENSFMCSFDVKSLFTNVPIDETINICLDSLYRCDDITPPGINEGLLRKLLVKCTSDVEFSFNGKMYRQIDGVAMGSPLGPILANIFLGFCESSIPDGQWPEFYRRYVDDTFSVFAGGKAEALMFLERLNSLHPALTFTMECESDRRLPFLDVHVIRATEDFSTTIYRKPTFSGLYTRWDSYCAPSQKFALIRSLALRAKRICSPEHLAGEIDNLKTIFTRNGYPLPITQRVIDRTLHPDPPVLTAGLKPICIRLPWLGEKSLSFSGRIERATRRLVPWCKPICCFGFRKAFNTCNKDVLPVEHISNVVYSFDCVCGHGYIGRTSQRLSERIKQHIPESLLPSVNVQRRAGRPRKVTRAMDSQTPPDDSVASRTRSRTARKREKPPDHVTSDQATIQLAVSGASSAITKHLSVSPTCLESVEPVEGRFSILSRARDLQHLQVLEAVYIAQRKPELCVQKEHLVKLCLV